MKIVIKLMHIPLISLLVFSAVGCDKSSEPVPDPVTPTPVDTTSVTPATPTDPNALYNGITLPAQWPPKRSYATEIRSGMNPFYLSDKPAVINIAIGRQLFVDDFLIESTSLTRQYHYAEYSENNPVLQPDKDWERLGSTGSQFAAPFSDGVWYDEVDQRFKMWYMAGGGTYSLNNTGVTCYAESTDGVNWTKPTLGVVDGTNIVHLNTIRDASTVWLDKQETNSSRRYKMFEVSGGAGKWQYHYLTSSDGKAWRDNATPSGSVADRSTVYKNPFRGVWVWSMRHNVRVNKSDPYTVRARDYMENSDPAAGNKLAKADLSYFWFGPWPNEMKHPDYNNNDGAPGIYNLDATPYESIMLGFFSVWQGPENDVCNADGVIKRNQIMLGFSRDGYSWYRQDMNPFLPVDKNLSAWNNGNLQSAAGSPIIVGDNLYFYLSGRRLVNGKEVTATGMAKLRRDGFASMSGTGQLTTSTLTFNGEYFFVNANVCGSLKVELLNADNTVINGFSQDECVAVSSADATKVQISWKNNKTLSTIKDKKIKVKFYLTDGDLYSFWISPYTTGESQGYTAGGGPGLNATGIDTK
jgi:hypothetical protein